MTPEELAERHPRLYHVTEPGAWVTIQKYGLLSTSKLLDLFEIPAPQRQQIETQRRSCAVPISHPQWGNIMINDNVPLSEKALKRCLNDDLSPADWLKILNSRVFFWPSAQNLYRLLHARLNRTRSRQVLVINTFSLAQKHAERMELSPINSGTTFRKAARRGKSTFSPLLSYSYHEWSRLRGMRDTIQEVTIMEGVLDIAAHVTDVIEKPPHTDLSKFFIHSN